MAEIKTIVNKVPIPAENKIKQKEYLLSGKLAVVDQGQNLIGGYTNEIQKEIMCEKPLIIFGDHTRVVKYITFPFAAGADGIKILKPKDMVLPKFLYYGMQYLVFKMPNNGYARHYQHLEKMYLSIPDKKQQQYIIDYIEELFSELDSAAEILKKTKQQLEVYRQAVLKEAFEGKYTKQWRFGKKLYDIGEFEQRLFNERCMAGNDKKYTQDEMITLVDLPANWKWVSLGDIVTNVEYGTSKKSLKSGKLPVIRMGNMKNGVIDWNDLVYSDDENEIRKYLLNKDDVLFNRTNSSQHVGKTSIYKGERPAIFAGYIIRINRLKEINPQYLTYYMNSYVARQYSNKVKTDGVNQSNINGKKLCTYPFPLCAPEEQEQIVEEIDSRFSICESIENTVETILRETQAMKQSILKQAFEGGLS